MITVYYLLLYRVERVLFGGYGRSLLSCSGESRHKESFKSLTQEVGGANTELVVFALQVRIPVVVRLGKGPSGPDK
jgi:hypothetical protein